MAKDRLPTEMFAQYVADYGAIRDDDPSGWPLPMLKRRIQSIVDNPELKRGNPPPIRPIISKGCVIKKPPESPWERRIKLARGFPETMTSREAYDRLGFDTKNASHKKAVSRVMKAVGFVCTRGRRTALWKKPVPEAIEL